MKRIFITVKGIVQGVGFRPFVYNIALKNNLKGWVNNNSEGVYIDIEGENSDIESFVVELKQNPPPLSKIEYINIVENSLHNFSEFTIRESERKENSITLISPDIATCDDCIKDIKDKNNRRYMYPFTNCTNCGPRFSIIKSIPYDRDKTTMKKFEMCKECKEEYTNPTNRRFHAQPNACSKCGPHTFIIDNQGNNTTPISTNEAFDTNEGIVDFINIKWTADKLNQGTIWAIKGLTGFHLVCNALDDETVSLLRKRKNRPHKPFAVMMKDLETVRRYCHVSKQEEELLTGIRKPIVLLRRRKEVEMPRSLAPGQNTLGVMLPFTPLHEILFSCNVEVLIMTSANIHGLPLEYVNENAFENLKHIADYFLMHDRDIYIPVDDSVTRVIHGKERVIRRARGYAPEPIIYKEMLPILACGSNMKNTVCISKENFLFLSQHNGDLENLETFEHYKSNIEHLKKIFLFNPEYLAADIHPEYYSTQYAMNTKLPVIQVQHHHAHIVSCMAENKISEKVIGISFDGTGFGTDGSIWGGEFLVCDEKSFVRTGHLNYIPMPGGEKAILEPWRMSLSYLVSCSDLEESEILAFMKNMGIDEKTAFPVLKALNKNINCIQTSSMGRFFDAVSAMLGICSKISYEGQASMELESINDESIIDYYEYSIDEFKENAIGNRDLCDTVFILNPKKIIKGILKDLKSNISVSIISSKFHNSIASASIDICDRIRNINKINKVALSGGVFQNSYLLNRMINLLEYKDFTTYTHSIIPSNDGGVALGQIIAADEILKSQNIGMEVFK